MRRPKGIALWDELHPQPGPFYPPQQLGPSGRDRLAETITAFVPLRQGPLGEDFVGHQPHRPHAAPLLNESTRMGEDVSDVERETSSK